MVLKLSDMDFIYQSLKNSIITINDNNHSWSQLTVLESICTTCLHDCFHIGKINEFGVLQVECCLCEPTYQPKPNGYITPNLCDPCASMLCDYCGATAITVKVERDYTDYDICRKCLNLEIEPFIEYL